MGKDADDNRVETQGSEKLLSLRQSSQKPQASFGSNDRLGMRVKGYDRGMGGKLMGMFDGGLDHFFMPGMDTVKSAKSHDRALKFALLRMADDLHRPNMPLTMSVTDLM